MSNVLEQHLEAVVDEASFVRFLEALCADFAGDSAEAQRQPPQPYGPGPRGWENGTVDGFLEAAAAWAVASAEQPAANPWRRCADILLAGKFYE